MVSAAINYQTPNISYCPKCGEIEDEYGGHWNDGMVWLVCENCGLEHREERPIIKGLEPVFK